MGTDAVMRHGHTTLAPLLQPHHTGPTATPLPTCLSCRMLAEQLFELGQLVGMSLTAQHVMPCAVQLCRDSVWYVQSLLPLPLLLLLLLVLLLLLLLLLVLLLLPLLLLLLLLVLLLLLLLVLLPLLLLLLLRVLLLVLLPLLLLLLLLPCVARDAVCGPTMPRHCLLGTTATAAMCSAATLTAAVAL